MIISIVIVQLFGSDLMLLLCELLKDWCCPHTNVFSAFNLLLLFSSFVCRIILACMTEYDYDNCIAMKLVYNNIYILVGYGSDGKYTCGTWFLWMRLQEVCHGLLQPQTFTYSFFLRAGFIILQGAFHSLSLLLWFVCVFFCPFC